MNQEQFAHVDQYITDLLVPSDAALDEALQKSAEAGLPPFNVAPNQGKLLHHLAQIQGARKILEIGTLGGYSTIWLARALPSDGLLVTLEIDRKYAEVAQANIARANLSALVELRLGPAVDSLADLDREGKGPFDFIFIDADKQNNPRYFAWALKLSRSGTVIIVDNVVRNGEVVDANSQDPRVQGTRELFQVLSNEKRVSATAIQTVGSKGWDGFVLATVNSK